MKPKNIFTMLQYTTVLILNLDVDLPQVKGQSQSASKTTNLQFGEPTFALKNLFYARHCSQRDSHHKTGLHPVRNWPRFRRLFVRVSSKVFFVQIGFTALYAAGRRRQFDKNCVVIKLKRNRCLHKFIKNRQDGFARLIDRQIFETICKTRGSYVYVFPKVSGNIVQVKNCKR